MFIFPAAVCPNISEIGWMDLINIHQPCSRAPFPIAFFFYKGLHNRPNSKVSNVIVHSPVQLSCSFTVRKSSKRWRIVSMPYCFEAIQQKAWNNLLKIFGEDRQPNTNLT